MIQKIKEVEVNKHSHSERGIALIMVLTSMVVMMAIWGEFTFESKISRIKTTNMLDKSQAKLLAESGLQLAIARLRLYKEASNTLSNNKDAKNMVSPQLLNQLWEVPFMYPIPLAGNVSAAIKESVQKFMDESLLEGEMKVTTYSMANKLNINMLRLSMNDLFQKRKLSQQNENVEEIIYPHQVNIDQYAATSNEVSISQSIYNTLKRLVDKRKETDEEFDDKYGNIDYMQLLANIAYYISDQATPLDSFMQESRQIFEGIQLTPKHAPFSSSSELYVIPGWDDVLIEMIQNEFSTYPTVQIDLNNLTENMLRLFFPLITDDEIKQFYELKNESVKPIFFNTLEDFKKFVVERVNWTTSGNFDQRMDLFKKKGFEFGPNPYMFKIVSEGTYNRSQYTLVAFVVLEKENKPPVGATATGSQGGAQSGSNNTTPGDTTTPNPGATTDQPTRLFEPKIIEIQVL